MTLYYTGCVADNYRVAGKHAQTYLTLEASDLSGDAIIPYHPWCLLVTARRSWAKHEPFLAADAASVINPSNLVAKERWNYRPGISANFCHIPENVGRIMICMYICVRAFSNSRPAIIGESRAAYYYWNWYVIPFHPIRAEHF